MNDNGDSIKHAVEMTEVKSELKQINETMNNIQRTLSELVAIDKKIAEVSMENKNIQKEVVLIWQKYDSVNEWQKSVDRELNRAHGARSVTTWVVSFIQMLAITIGGYVALELNKTQRVNDVQDSRLQANEQRLNNLNK